MIKKDNKRVMITFNPDTYEKLDYLCKFLQRSKTNTIMAIIDYMYDKIK